MDDETLAECFYELLMGGKHDDTALELIRREVVEASDLPAAERAKALYALERLARTPGDPETIQALYGLFHDREDFVLRMARKLAIALAGEDSS